MCENVSEYASLLSDMYYSGLGGICGGFAVRWLMLREQKENMRVNGLTRDCALDKK